MTDETPSSRRWLHQAVAGAAVRAALAVGGLAPAFAWMLAQGAPALVVAQLAVGAFVYAAALFALERRGAPWPETLARLAVGGLAGAPLGWAAGASLEHAGDPTALWAAMARGAARVEVVELFGLAFGALLFTQVVGAWFHVRARTERAGPQVVCGILIVGLPLLLLVGGDLASGGRVRGEVVISLVVTLACGALVPLLVALGEARWVQARVDPQAPRAARGEARPAIAGVGLVLLLLLSVVGAVEPFTVTRKRSPEAAAIGALKTIATSQTVFREGDKDGDGVLDYAASLGELSRAALVDPVLGAGVKQGYVYRVLRSATEPEYRWIAAAEPLVPDATRAFVINHTGAIHYRRVDEGPPVALDVDTCALPEGWRRVGR
ncbi:MAG: hypothetical protein M9894_13950 [Planctomycetes bacterium]|nr:hypothetical protein [Planctomycetota bacterium]